MFSQFPHARQTLGLAAVLGFALVRSHVGTVGTRTNMVKVVARIIPHDL
jgi:hypothetical protein